VILKAVSDPEAIVRIEACRALGKVGKPEDATVLTRVMTIDTLEDCRIAAIDALAELKPNDARITRVLVVALQSDDPATRYASLNALRRITGRDLGVDPGPWQKLLPDEAEKAMIASKGGTATAPPQGNVAAAPPATSPPVYPPRPVPRPDPDIDGSAHPVGFPPSPGSSSSH